MKLNLNYWGRWELTLICFALLSCGLPSSTSVGISTLNKPELETYVQGNTLYLQITGYYPSDEFPDFLGYNIYAGENNDPDKVIQRVMYISSDSELPSYEVPLSQSTSTITIPISEDIRFRYSKHADSDQIPEGIDRNALFAKPLVNYERYYFVVEAVEKNRTGNRSEAQKIIFVKYQSNLTWNYSNTFNSIEVFKDLEVTKNSFILPGNTTHSFSITSIGSVDSVYQSIPESDQAYNQNPHKPYRHHIYFFRATKNDSQVDEYLSLWVEDITEDALIVSYGHRKEILSDFVNDATPVVGQ